MPSRAPSSVDNNEPLVYFCDERCFHKILQLFGLSISYQAHTAKGRRSLAKPLTKVFALYIFSFPNHRLHNCIGFSVNSESVFLVFWTVVISLQFVSRDLTLRETILIASQVRDFDLILYHRNRLLSLPR